MSISTAHWQARQVVLPPQLGFITALTGSLSNGATYTVTDGGNGQQFFFSGTTPGDVRIEGGAPFVIDFSTPVNLSIKPVTDVSLGTPSSWTYQSAPNIFPDRALSNGDLPIYNAGTLDLALAINSAVTTPQGTFEEIIATTSTPSNPPANGPWGEVLLNNVTQVRIRQRNNSGLNFELV